MRRLLDCLLVILILAGSRSAPAHTLRRGTFDGRRPTRRIRQVDFNNFTCHTPNELVRIRHGRGVYKGFGDAAFSFDVAKVKVVYGDLTRDGAEEAIVVLYYTGGGTGAFTKGFLFTMRGGRLELLTEIKGGDRADGGINEVRVEDGILSVERNEPERMKDAVVGLCCARYLITTKYRWEGRKLVQVGEPRKVDAKES